MRSALVALTVLLALGRLAAAPQGVKPGEAKGEPLAIIVHHSNPVEGLSSERLRRIFLFETQAWPNGRKVTVVLREKGQPERAEGIRLVCGMSVLEFDRHVLLQTYRGDLGLGPRSIRSAPAMLRFVFNVPGAIGYVLASEVDASIKVLRIDGLLPRDPEYPLRRRVGPAGAKLPER